MRWTSGAAAALAAASLLAPAAGGATPEPTGGSDTLVRPSDPAGWLAWAAESAHRVSFAGEALLVSWDGTEPHVAQTEVANAGVPAPDAVSMTVDVNVKYRLEFARPEALMARPCAVVEVRRRADDLLRERLWIDRATGLLLRRESYGEDGEHDRIASYLALELGADGVPVPEFAPAPAISDGEVTALRAAGWEVPRDLREGYELVAVYAGAGEDGEGDAAPIHGVYSDGLYTLSLFEQPGQLDWGSLPAGGRQLADVPGHAVEWPGTVPGRVVWVAGGATYTLLGDAPRDEVVSIVAMLAEPAPSPWGRVTAGLRRLWSWLVP